MAKSMPKQQPGRSVQDVCTPAAFLHAVLQRLGIDNFAVDLAASRENSVAAKCYTKRSNALEQSWRHGGWNWLNPPFADLGAWVKKAYEESRTGARTAMLVPAAVGANWWREWVDQKARVLLLNGRLTFVGHSQPYPKDCALLLYAASAPGIIPGYETWRWTDPPTSKASTHSRSVEPWNQQLVDETPADETLYWLSLTEAEARAILGRCLLPDDLRVFEAIKSLLAWADDDEQKRATA